MENRIPQSTNYTTSSIGMILGGIELKFVDGTEIAIDCTAVENLTANNMYERFELDYLIYNAPLAYADLILNGNPETYLKAVIVCKPFEN